jgi:hypothetical protein
MPDRSSRCRKLALGLFASLIGVLLTVFGFWGNLVEKDKSIPQWFGERGWPNMIVVVGLYLVGALVVAILFYLLCRRIDRPKLKGEIECVNIDACLTRKFSDTVYDCFVTLRVTAQAKNDLSSVARRWELELLWQGEEYLGTEQEVDQYEAKDLHAHPTPNGTVHEIGWKRLTAFPTNELITESIPKTGWLRFKVASLPVDAVADNNLSRAVVLRLKAFDGDNKPHLIYGHTVWKLADCVVRRTPDNDFFFA